MSEGAGELQALEEAAARDEALARLAAKYCASVDPQNVDTFNRALAAIPVQGRGCPFEMPRGSDFDLLAESGRAAYRRDLAARKLSYLEQRADVLRERQGFRERLREPSLPDLDGVVDATRNDPESRAELHAEQFEARQAALTAERERVAEQFEARKARK